MTDQVIDGEDQEVSPSRSQPYANGSLPVLTETRSLLARQTYRGWTISYDPPPIPVRDMDWHFVHPDFDASWEGEEVGYMSNGLAGHGSSVEDCKAQIDDIEEERCAGGCVNHPDRPVRTNLDGDDLCQECADEWVRGEGQAAAEAAWDEAAYEAMNRKLP